MPLPYKQNKVHIYSWRENNHERYNEINKLSKRRYDEWKRVSKIFLNILID